MLDPASSRGRGKDSAAAVRPPDAAAPKLGVLDLLDIVAGGDGTGHLREAGIDPATGAKDPFSCARAHQATGSISRVAWNRLIDGVFIPNGKAGPGATRFGRPHLRLAGDQRADASARSGRGRPDIAGEAADGTTGAPGSMRWGGAASTCPTNRGLLGLHANAGITFDLEAICKAHPASPARPFPRLRRLGQPLGAGRSLGVRRRTTEIPARSGWCKTDSPVRIEVELEANDRFLTLVSTDGNHGDATAIGSSLATPYCWWLCRNRRQTKGRPAMNERKTNSARAPPRRSRKEAD